MTILLRHAGGYLTPNSRFSCASASSQFCSSCPAGRPRFSQIWCALWAIWSCVRVGVAPVCRCPADCGACCVARAGFAAGSPPTGFRCAVPAVWYDRLCFGFALVAFGVPFRDIQSLHPRSCTTLASDACHLSSWTFTFHSVLGFARTAIAPNLPVETRPVSRPTGQVRDTT